MKLENEEKSNAYKGYEIKKNQVYSKRPVRNVVVQTNQYTRHQQIQKHNTLSHENVLTTPLAKRPP